MEQMIPTVEADKPIEFPCLAGNVRHIATPPSWTLHTVDEQDKMPMPRRLSGAVTLTDRQDFVRYVARHATPAAVIYVDVKNFASAPVIRAVLNDHQPGPSLPGWADHTASYTPELSVEWTRWNTANKNELDQATFATWLEDNIADVHGGSETDGSDIYPSGTQMLEMATRIEITKDFRCKSAVNLDSGGVRLELVDDNNAETTERLMLFRRFRLGIRVFRGGAGYPLIVRLRHKIKSGHPVFTYELIRPDLVMETAIRELLEQLGADLAAANLDVPVFLGNRN